MKNFLKFALKSQWKTILVILGLVALQTFFQIEIINLFAAALKDVKSRNADMLFDDGKMMLAYTVLSMVVIYAVSFLSTGVSSRAAYDTRERIFHILMNLPDGEIGKFKVTGLITRSTRGVYSEQGFIMLILKYVMIIPFVFVAIVIEMALIDGIFAGLFAAVVIIMALILIFKLRQVTTIYFKAKATYGKLNLLFLSKINSLANNVPFKKREACDEFKMACRDSYDKNIRYQLSQYYIGPVLLLILDVIVVVLLAMMVLGHPIGFEAESAVDSVVLIQYILYFISTLMVVPTLIELWPRSYATSIRLEEVLSLEDRIIKTENNNSKRIEIAEDDIKDDDSHILVDRKKIIQKFNKVLEQHRREVIVSMILVTVSTLCIAYAPKVAGNIINLILLDSNSSHDHQMLINVGLLFALYSIGCLFRLPSNRLMAFIGEKTACNLRMELFEKLDAIDSNFIQKNSKGHVLSRLNNDLMNVREFVTVHVSEIFAQFLSILFVIILVLTTDWRLAMIYLITLPIYIICFYHADVKSKDQYENHQRQLGRMMSYFERSLTDRSMFHEKGFVKINKRVSDNFVKSINISNTLLPLVTFLTNLSKITVYIVGLYFLMAHEIQLGTLLAVIIYGQLLTKPLKKVSTSMVFLETSFSSIKRIFAIIDS
jgi:ABC-type multidrug transport system fused ATPase/permease subunit